MKKVLIGLGVAFVLVNLLLFGFRYILLERGLERYVDANVPTGNQTATVQVVSGNGRIKVAIVLDDVGIKTTDYLLLRDIPFRLNLAVIPGLKNSKDLVKEFAQDGRYELLLHMPMEPMKNAVDEESKESMVSQNFPFVITHTLSPRKIRKTLDQAFDAIDGYGVIKGMNNHQGSLITASANYMNTILDWAHREHMYFLDSISSRSSIAYEVARKKHIPSLYNEMYLDDTDDADYILGQLEKLRAKAEQDGQAVGIGHITRQHTLQVLASVMSQMAASENVTFVWVSELLPKH